MKNYLVSSCFVVVSLVASAEAGVVNFALNSNSGVGSGASYGAGFQGTVQWSYTSGSAATVTLSLTNTSSVTSNLVAFVMGRADSSMTFSQVSAPTNFAQIKGKDLKATPFGDFDWGSASTGSFNGSGNTMGLAKGQSGTWVFSVSGTSAALAGVSTPAVFNGVNDWDFVVHIKGMTSGTTTVSEKLTSTFGVPAPGVAALLGLAALATRRRR
jgi:MYXO-CTERM domain-containing protein